MSINSITDGVTTFKLPEIKVAGNPKQPAKDTSEVVVQPIIQKDSKVTDTSKVVTPVGKVDQNAVRAMSHVAESYDAKGNTITKYMDSSNNVIYQTPSELVIKTQELMAKTQATANIKG